MRAPVVVMLAAGLALAAGCEPGEEQPGEPAEPAPTPTDSPTPAEEPDEPDEVEVATEVVAEHLEVPWEIAWAGDDVYVTQRDTGELHRLDPDTGESQAVDSFDVDPAGEGGLLGLAVHPDDDETLYAYYSSAEHGDNRIVRFTPGQADDADVVVDGIPHNSFHNGGRLAFGPDDHLYATTGDAGQEQLSQDETSLAGAILRVTPEGEVPDDNPSDGEVYATGIRNAQGLSWTADGDLIAAEFGPDADDEINVIEAGGNYGWPEVTGEAGVDSYIDPIFVQQPPAASWSGAQVLVDGAIPQWEGDAFAASLRGQRLWRLDLDDEPGVAGSEELLVEEFGRLRQVTQGPDGALWILTSNRDGRGSPDRADDRVIRLGPAGG